MLVRSPLALFLLIAAVLLGAAPDASARRASCKRGERRVVKGTAAYGGPALGFEVSYVFPATRCVAVLRTTEDGSFALVPIDDGRVGWVAAGLVEADLSEDKGAKPTPVTSPYDVLALRATSIRRQPRFDARVVTTVDAKQKLKVTGTSPDGLWLFVEAKGGEGWVSRYQTARELPSAESTPSAGDAPWVIRGPTTTATPVAPPKASLENAAAADAQEGDTSAGEAADEGKRGAPDAVAAPVDGSARWLGRGQEVSFAVSLGQWSQRYLSDAQNDAFYKYDLSSTGPAATLAYAYRGDFPVVADVRLNLGLFGFDLVPPGAADPVYTPVFVTDLAAHVGWRLHGDAHVDVEAGVGAGTALVWIGDLEVAGDRVDAFTPGLYLDALRPYVAARTRLAGGDLGLVSLEAAIPLGGYLMVYDPGSKYLEDFKDVPIVDAPKPPRPGDEDADPDAEVEPPVLHPALGVEARLRYALPLGDVVRLRASLALGVRQAFIGGPGVRASGIYTEATNIDFLGSFDLGADFSF